MREFKALAEFFQLNWDFERRGANRPQSLAWEIKKSNAPKIKRHLKSPTVSGKSSPNSMTSSKSSNHEEKFLKFKRYTENLRHNLHPMRGDEFENLFREIPSLAIDNFELGHKPKSMSLENLVVNVDVVSSQPVVPMRDNESQTEGFEDDNLTLLEFMEKRMKQENAITSKVDEKEKEVSVSDQQPPLTTPVPPPVQPAPVITAKPVENITPKPKIQKKVSCAVTESAEVKKSQNDTKNLKARVKSPNLNVANNPVKSTTQPGADGWTMVTRRKSQASISRSNTSTSLKDRSNTSLNTIKSAQRHSETTRRNPQMRSAQQNRTNPTQPGAIASTANSPKVPLTKKKNHSTVPDKNTKNVQNYVQRQKSGEF